MEATPMTQDEIDSLYPSEWYINGKVLIRHLSDDTTEIMLTQFYTVIIQTKNIHKVENSTCSIKRSRKNFYPTYYSNGKHMYMSNIIDCQLKEMSEFSLSSAFDPHSTSYYKYGKCRVRWAKIKDDLKVEVLLTQGKAALIDQEKLDLVSEYKWHLLKDKTNLYAQSNTEITMHRLFLPDAEEVDHKDRYGLNNTLENLRKATKKENQNNRNLCLTNKTGVNGVHLDKQCNRYRFTWLEKGIEHRKSFGMSKYGSNEEALNAAKEYAVQVHERTKNYNGKRSYAEVEKECQF
jgi:hypothetical protein